MDNMYNVSINLIDKINRRLCDLKIKNNRTFKRCKVVIGYCISNYTNYRIVLEIKTYLRNEGLEVSENTGDRIDSIIYDYFSQKLGLTDMVDSVYLLVKDIENMEV